MAAIFEAARVGGKTSLVEVYQILRCGEEYPGSVNIASFNVLHKIIIRIYKLF
jgi:hypothetical protein